MSAPTPPNGPEFAARPGDMNEVGVIRALVQVVRNRIVSGLFAALPFVLTVFIVRYLYITAMAVLTPLIELIRKVLGTLDPSNTFWYGVFAPAVAVVLVLIFLYGLGLFVQTRWARAIDWVFLRVPVVNTIFKALTNVFEALGRQMKGDHGFKRIVLVEFPHPGMRSLAFVTNTLHDAGTDRTILCVCVLTGVMPPAGFTLFVPEDSVADVDWSVNQTLQAILSGGITAPGSIHYFRGPLAPATGPVLDPAGQPVASGGDTPNAAGG